MNDNISLTDEVKMSTGKGFNDCMSLEGRFTAKLYGPDGTLLQTTEVFNTVTTLGKRGVLDQYLAAPTVAKAGWMELGTGSGQTAASTILAAFIAGSRTALDSKTRVNSVITMVCTFGAGVGTGAVTEAGVFNIVTENTTDLVLYSSFPVINKGALDSLVVTWTLTQN